MQAKSGAGGLDDGTLSHAITYVDGQVIAVLESVVCKRHDVRKAAVHKRGLLKNSQNWLHHVCLATVKQKAAAQNQRGQFISNACVRACVCVCGEKSPSLHRFCFTAAGIHTHTGQNLRAIQTK